VDKYFDIVNYNLIKNNSLEELETLFSELNIFTVYVCKSILVLGDVNDFEIPKSKTINFKKIFLINNLSLLNKIKNNDVNLICKPNNLSELSKLLNNQKSKLIYSPIFNKLGFDEGCCNLCSQNSKQIIFDLNLFRNNTYKSIKQSLFIFNILQQHKVKFCFSSFANTKEELIDPNVSKYFLENFNIDSSLIDKVFRDNHEL
jgi:hypothetical protein